jgi:hypothetical protein
MEVLDHDLGVLPSPGKLPHPHSLCRWITYTSDLGPEKRMGDWEKGGFCRFSTLTIETHFSALGSGNELPLSRVTLALPCRHHLPVAPAYGVPHYRPLIKFCDLYS